MDKKIITIGIGSVVGLLIIGGGVWYAMMRDTPSEILPQDNVTQETPVENGEDALKKLLAEREILLSQSDDKDGDGLTDSEELKLGTNPQKIDTDNDGLTDHFEVNVLKTDPKRADSDGDGISDWNEDYKLTSDQ
jgi:Bacterial TSP3 repeat